MGKLIKHWELVIEINSKGMETGTYNGTGSVHQLTLKTKPKVENGMLKYTHTRDDVDCYVDVGISLELVAAYSILAVFED